MPRVGVELYRFQTESGDRISIDIQMLMKVLITFREFVIHPTRMAARVGVEPTTK